MAIGQLNYWVEESAESQQARAEGSKLYMVLKTFFALPIAKGTIIQNFYTADGIWFQLKLHPNDVAADGNPLHESTTAVAGHHKAQGKASTTFTLYVGHMTPDDSFPGWAKPKALPVRELGLFNTNYTQIRAALATLIDAVTMDYERALPHYQAWLAMQSMPTDAQAQTDYLRQLIRQALRRMPASELLTEPVAIPEADAADEAARMDAGEPVEPTVTLTTLQEKADGIIGLLDEMLAVHGLPPTPDEFDGYDTFDPDDESDNLDDDDGDDEDDEDDSTDPDTSDYDTEDVQVAI